MTPDIRVHHNGHLSAAAWRAALPALVRLLDSVPDEVGEGLLVGGAASVGGGASVRPAPPNGGQGTQQRVRGESSRLACGGRRRLAGDAPQRRSTSNIRQPLNGRKS